MFAASASGSLLLKENEQMNHLLTIMEISTKHLDNSYLRAELQLINPSQSYIDADSLRNFRLWAKKQIIARSEGKQSTSPLVTKQSLELMFADQIISRPKSSIAVEQAEELHRSLLKDTMESKGNTWKVEKYLKTVANADDCFDFRIARDADTGSATAVIWQTGTMRADFELYGCALHIDFMKRKLNSYEWPYISLVVIDSNGSPLCAAEGIACVE